LCLGRARRYGLDVPSGQRVLPLPIDAYEPPTLVEIGSFEAHTLTGLHGCYWNKQFGGSDGFTFMGISVPISNCSS
jgi:hypothetical protein